MDVGVLGIVATVLVGLAAILAAIIVTHLYHVRAGREQKAMLGKLPDEIVDILKEDTREKFTILELNELILEKSIDWDAVNDPPGLPYKACPRCGNTDLKGGTSYGPGDHVYYYIQCKECEWLDWTE